MNIPNLRKKLLTRRAVFVALLALVLCALAALIAFCLPRAVNPSMPDAPITRALTLTPTSTLTATPTNHPTITQAPSMTYTPTDAPTQTPTLTPTLQPTDTPTPTRTPIHTIVPGRNGTMPTTGAAQDSGAFWTILGVVLLALGFWIYDAASKDNPTW